MFGPISDYAKGFFASAGLIGASAGSAGMPANGSGSSGTANAAVAGTSGAAGSGTSGAAGSGTPSAAAIGSVRTEQEAKDAGLSDAQITQLKRSGRVECATCSSRKYQDGSDENVSFKTAQHVSPEAAGSAVRAHEQEHVSNAYTKAAKDNGKVVNASVTIHTAICPECGRTYVSGGVTHTQIKYNSDTYSKQAKARDRGLLSGMNFDASA